MCSKISRILFFPLAYFVIMKKRSNINIFKRITVSTLLIVPALKANFQAILFENLCSIQQFLFSFFDYGLYFVHDNLVKILCSYIQSKNDDKAQVISRIRYWNCDP